MIDTFQLGSVRQTWLRAWQVDRAKGRITLSDSLSGVPHKPQVRAPSAKRQEYMFISFRTSWRMPGTFPVASAIVR